MRNQLDFRKTINSLQFLAASPNIESFMDWDHMAHWPYKQSGQCWHKTPETQHLLNDDQTDVFLVSNFLRLFSRQHPAVSSPPAPFPAFRLDSVSPSLLPLEGAQVTIKGSMSAVAEVLLLGCDEGATPLPFSRVSSGELQATLPPLPHGLYHLLFFAQDGRQLLCSREQPWFGREAVLVTKRAAKQP